MPSKFIIIWKGAKCNPVLKSYHLPRALSNPSSKIKKFAQINSYIFQEIAYILGWMLIKQKILYTPLSPGMTAD